MKEDLNKKYKKESEKIGEIDENLKEDFDNMLKTGDKSAFSLGSLVSSIMKNANIEELIENTNLSKETLEQLKNGNIDIDGEFGDELSKTTGMSKKMIKKLWKK